MRFTRSLLAVMLAGAAVLIGAQSALAYEWDIATPGDLPGGLPCTETEGSKVCFESHGEKFWVKDTFADSYSAIAKWTMTWGVREGYCRNALGEGKWGYCNKSFEEGRRIDWWAARYDRDTNQFYGPWSAGRWAWA